MLPSATVETTSGRVRGQAGGSTLAFKGIPYAQGPIGRLRFAPPEPPLPWAGTLDALDYGPVAPQPFAPLEALLGGGNAPQSEEGCLTLNVWTPGLDEGLRPVMVWIHGGAFVTGSGAAPWYDGSALAGGGDVVVVTFNYRLGALGFMCVGANDTGAEVSCNFGLLDQLAALSWVRENSAAFGGDPERVTIFGQSAGAMSIGALLGVPALPLLAKRAVLQSGACLHTMSLDAAARNSATLLDRLGLSPGAPDTLGSLRALPTAAFLAAQTTPLPAQVHGLGLLPVVDGVTLALDPLEAVRRGAVASMDLLIGTNADEARIFTLSDPDLADMDGEGLLARSPELWGPDMAAVARAVKLYERSRPNALPRDIWAAMSTDEVFRIPAIRLAEAAAAGRISRAADLDSHDGAGAATFAYLFRWPTPAFGGVFGACHSLEVPFVFDNLHQPGMSMLTSQGASAGTEPPADLLVLATRMRDAWAGFAHVGTPAVDGCDEWPAYCVAPSSSGSGYRATMSFDISCAVVEDPGSEERLLWEAAR